MLNFYALFILTERETERKVFDPYGKRHLVIGGETLVGKRRGQMFLLVGHQVCAHIRMDFGSLPYTDTLQILKASRPSLGNSKLWSLGVVQSFLTLSRETATEQNVSTYMFDRTDGVLGVTVSNPLPTTAVSQVDAKELNPSPQPSLNHSDVHWQTSEEPVHVPS